MTVELVREKAANRSRETRVIFLLEKKEEDVFLLL